MDDPRQNPAGSTAVIKVVIVDDDLYVRTALARLLDSYPDLHITNTYEHGAEALEAARADPPDVMLVDVAMPKMSGTELTRLIREHVPSVHVLALTSLTSDETLSEMLRAGALGLLYKDTSTTPSPTPSAPPAPACRSSHQAPATGWPSQFDLRTHQSSPRPRAGSSSWSQKG